jgi:hypothetical protein
MEYPLHRIRLLEKHLSTKEVALVLCKSTSWVRIHKNLFDWKRKGRRNLKYELTSVIQVYWKYYHQNLLNQDLW